jgi:pimeloyl-ACP methyl ester carboxylesterase/DNA-binding CsgD family transcriptional regulator
MPRLDDAARAMAQARQQIRFCSAHDGVRIAYAMSGRGPPLVKVANWLSHLEYDWESPVWRPLLAELSRDHTLVRYDERGCGLSDWNVEDLSFDAWIHDLETVVEAAGVDRFPLLGISQGASIACAYAVRHPERVTQLILHGGYTRGRLRRAKTPQQRDEAEMMIRLAEIGWGRENPAFRQFFTTQFIPDGTPEQHRWWNELVRISTSPANAARIMRNFGEIDVGDLLTRVACPTLVLHATHDARVPFEEGRMLAGLIPGARFVPIESNNHVLLDSEPGWQRWLDEVRAFLPHASTADPAFARLTQRERALLELIAQGRDNAQIAARLGLSEKTVRNHITSIFAKLEVDNRARAIVVARNAGFGTGAD